MLKRKEKEAIVKDLTQAFKAAKSIVIVDYTGLTVAGAEELRDQLIKAKLAYKVCKKTLISLALKKIGLEVDLKKLKVQVAVAYGADEIMPAKIVAAFARKNEGMPKLLAGTLADKVLSLDEVKNLAAMPSYDELLAKTVYAIKAPVTGLVNVLRGNMRNLVYALKAIQESKA